MRKIMRRAYHALPAVRRKAENRASAQLADQTAHLYADALEATAAWPNSWRRALTASLPAIGDFPSQAQRAKAFKARVAEAAAIVERGQVVARKLYGLDFAASSAQLDAAIATDPSWWRHVESVVSQHLVRRSPLPKAASDLLEALAAQQDASQVDTALCDRPAPAGAISGAWAKTIAKFQAAGNAS
jgi:hypothetical protein